jgi:hypothetical protein
LKKRKRDLIAQQIEHPLATVASELTGPPASTAATIACCTAPTIWRQLLESAKLCPRWDDHAKALRIGFGETTDGERETMRRDLCITQPTLADLGGFDDVTINDVALRAATAEDATRWAEWRLRARVRDYATTRCFNAWSSEASAPFAEDAMITTPSRKTLANEAWRSRGERPAPAAWHLIAAEDGSL